MKKTVMREKLLVHIEQSHFIKIEREKIDEDPFHCIPISMGKKLILIKKYIDFLFDGFVLIRFKDITEVRYDEVDQFAEHILQNENAFGKTNNVAVNQLDNWKDTFNEIKRLNKFIRLECDEGDFIKYNFGEIIDVHSDGIIFHHFNALGKWDDQPLEVKFKDIILVEIDDRYTSIFSKYVEKR